MKFFFMLFLSFFLSSGIHAASHSEEGSVPAKAVVPVSAGQQA